MTGMAGWGSESEIDYSASYGGSGQFSTWNDWVTYGGTGWWTNPKLVNNIRL